MRRNLSLEKFAVAAHQNIEAKNYWLNKLSGELLKTSFLYDYKKSGKNERHMDTVKFKFSPGTSSKLVTLSSENDHTLNVILAAGLVVLLNKYTGYNDIMVGAPIYKQDIEAEFVNTVLVLRNQFEDNITFRELLLLVGRSIVEATDNYSYPIEILTNELNMPVSENDDFPLFDVVILLENIHDKDYIRHINTSMVCSFLRTDEPIEGTIEYNSLLYSEKTIERISRHFKNVFYEVLFNFRTPDIRNVNLLI